MQTKLNRVAVLKAVKNKKRSTKESAKAHLAWETAMRLNHQKVIQTLRGDLCAHFIHMCEYCDISLPKMRKDFRLVNYEKSNKFSSNILCAHICSNIWISFFVCCVCATQTDKTFHKLFSDTRQEWSEVLFKSPQTLRYVCNVCKLRTNNNNNNNRSHKI